jgi:hypothetical protein
MPFLVSATDNIVRPDELRRLAYEWEEHKLEEVSKLVWSVAQDLVLWCLQTKPQRRPQSFAEILSHPFFGGEDELHFLRDADDTLSAATVWWAIELHTAIETDDIATVQRLVDRGCVHYNLCLQGDHLTVAQRSITPVHRAARHGRVEILRILLDEVHPQALANVIDAQTQYDHTALHWACVYGHSDVARELIVHGCDTGKVNHRNKTAWDLAEQLFLLEPAIAQHTAEVKALLKSFASNQYEGKHEDDLVKTIGSSVGTQELLAGKSSAWQVLMVFIELASAQQSGDDGPPLYEALHQERGRRARRPEVKDTFRDDIEIDPSRLTFWSITPFAEFDEGPLAEGGFGKVFDAAANPDIEVAGRRFRRVALKVPKPEVCRA